MHETPRENVGVSMFQSSPSPKAGRYDRAVLRLGGHPCFNPRPARRPGATRIEDGEVAAWFHVSILAQPEGRALRRRLATIEGLLKVSILAQPEGRALLQRADVLQWRHVFQSSPSPKAGRYILAAVVVHGQELVSILAQPEGRALRDDRRPWQSSNASFNPRPARRPGATAVGNAGSVYRTMFQSSPSPKAGRYDDVFVGVAGLGEVSILAQPEGRALRRHLMATVRSLFRFNPRPARRPGAT